MRTIEQMVQSEVLCCMSSIVHTLAGSYGVLQEAGTDLNDLSAQAFELSCPIQDYEEAARQAGWKTTDFGHYLECAIPYDELQDSVQGYDTDSGVALIERCEGDWEYACRVSGVEPYDREVFEHWAVTEWFADKLIEQGEKVDKDFGNLCVWARTTTGQGIASDSVVERIYADMMKA